MDLDQSDSNVQLPGAAGQDTAQHVDAAAQPQAKANGLNPGAIRKSTTQALLGALSNASGQQFTNVEDAIAWAARRGALNQHDSDGYAQPKSSEQKAVDTSDLAEQFAKLKDDLNRKDQLLREKALEQEISRAMRDRFDPDLLDYAISKIKQNIKFDNDGQYKIYNAKGQERYSSDGNLLTIKQLVEEVAQGNPKLLKQNAIASGSGLKPNMNSYFGTPDDSVPDYSKDPAAFNAWANKLGLSKGSGLKSIGVSASAAIQSKRIL